MKILKTEKYVETVSTVFPVEAEMGLKARSAQECHCNKEENG